MEKLVSLVPPARAPAAPIIFAFYFVYSKHLLRVLRVLLETLVFPALLSGYACQDSDAGLFHNIDRRDCRPEFALEIGVDRIADGLPNTRPNLRALSRVRRKIAYSRLSLFLRHFSCCNSDESQPFA